MKNRIEWRNRLAVMLAFAMMAVSCKDDGTAVSEQLSVSQARLDIDKSGLAYDGAEAVAEVTSDAFWLITIPSGTDWVTVSPMAAAGSAKITISATPNAGPGRTAELVLETQRGTRAVLTVRQGDVSERTVYLLETLGTGASMVPVGGFDAWNFSGTGIAGLTHTGNDVFIDSAEPSGYDNASGGNNVLFPETGAQFTIGPTALHAGIDLQLRFGVYFPSETDMRHLRVQASKDAKNWTTLPFSCAPASGWSQALSRFYVDPEDASGLYFRFTSQTPGVRIDDICLIEGEPGEGELLEFGSYVDDGKEVGYIYFEDNFDWVTADFGGTDFIGNYPSATAEMRFDLVTDLSLKTILDNSGWTTTIAQGPVYLRLGYIKLGKTKVAGDVLTPALSGIADGASIDLTVTFDVAMMEWKTVQDLDGLIIEAVGDGTVNGTISSSQRFGVQSWNAWKTLSVKIYGATNKTRIRFTGAWTDAEMKAQNKSNRFFLDNVKVAKALPVEE